MRMNLRRRWDGGWGMSRIGWKFGMVEDRMSGCFVWGFGEYFCFKKVKDRGDLLFVFNSFKKHRGKEREAWQFRCQIQNLESVKTVFRIF